MANGIGQLGPQQAIGQQAPVQGIPPLQLTPQQQQQTKFFGGVGDFFGDALSTVGSGIGSLFGGGAPSAPAPGGGSGGGSGFGLGDIFTPQNIIGAAQVGLPILQNIETGKANEASLAQQQAQFEASQAEGARQFDINNDLARQQMASSAAIAGANNATKAKIAKAELQQRAAEAAINAALTGRQAEANALNQIAANIRDALNVGGPV